MKNCSYHVKWKKSRTENYIIFKRFTTKIWSIKYGEVKGLQLSSF